MVYGVTEYGGVEIGGSISSPFLGGTGDRTAAIVNFETRSTTITTKVPDASVAKINMPTATISNIQGGSAISSNS